MAGILRHQLWHLGRRQEYSSLYIRHSLSNKHLVDSWGCSSFLERKAVKAEFALVVAAVDQIKAAIAIAPMLISTVSQESTQLTGRFL